MARLTLTTRLFLAVAALVGVTALVAWLLAGRVVFRPFAEAVFEAQLDQAVYVAEEVEGGEPPSVLSDRMNLEVQVETAGPAEGAHWRTVARDGRELWFRPGPRNVVYVESGDRWVTVHRALDFERPERRFSWLLLLGVAVILAVAGWLARAATRPVATATRAMARIASGELGHRLEPVGPAELRAVAHGFNRMAETVEAMVRAEKQLMAGVSHELRTPLARLRLQIELLADSGADPARLRAMEEEVAELDGLIGELLALSRLQLGDRRLQRETVDLRMLASEAVGAVGLAGRRVEVRGEAVAEVDRSLVRRALVNLLSNVDRYTPAGTSVSIAVSREAIVVEDEGPGVPEHDLRRLFEPFYRAEASRSRETGGLGLGLMIVQQVARLHGGSVRAENRVGGGLRVVLQLG